MMVFPLHRNFRMMVGVKQRYSYHLYQHPDQKIALAKAFGYARVVWVVRRLFRCVTPWSREFNIVAAHWMDILLRSQDHSADNLFAAGADKI
jgi:hypothetical protein